MAKSKKVNNSNLKMCGDCCPTVIDIGIQGDGNPPVIDIGIQGDGGNPTIDVNIPETKVDYNEIINKPKINGEVLIGDKTGDELGLVEKSTEPKIVYGTDNKGKPTTIPYSVESTPSSIVQRDENGDIIISETPASDGAAASKKYVDTCVEEALEKAVEFKGIVDNQTLLPEEGNKNGDMYWIKEFVEPVPAGITKGLGGTAIYNAELGEFEFENDEIYEPDGKTITLDDNGSLAVKLSEEPNNSIVVKEDGLHVDVSHIEEKLSTEVGKRLKLGENTLQLLNENNDVISEVPRTFVFEQGRASNEWVVIHTLNKYPSVVVVDSAGNEIEPSVEYNTKNKVTIRFNASFSGKAFLN